MSALGHKPTYAPQQAMSALPPIATAKADIRGRMLALPVALSHALVGVGAAAGGGGHGPLT
jgi:hypothetical protein